MMETKDDRYMSSITQISTDATLLNNNQTVTRLNNSLSYWSLDASLSQRRLTHEAVLLANGKIMVAGGRSYMNIILQICEFYSTSIGWQTGPVMKNPRYYYTLTLFANNTKALAAGSAQTSYQQTAEIYDSINNTWTLTSTNMTVGRYAHAAILLKNEHILIIGGKNSSYSILSDVELFTPSSNSFIKSNRMNIGRAYFASTLLKDGLTVLVTGGGDPNFIMTAIAELYILGSWIFTTNNMIQPRAYHSTVLLNNGNVLIAGGGDGASVSYSTAEIYNSTTRTFTSIQPMKYRRALFTLTLLPSGKVLAIGGIDWITNTYPVICELYDPVTNTWSNTRILNNGRSFHRTILLNNSVLTTAGYTDQNDRSNTCEKYYL